MAPEMAPVWESVRARLEGRGNDNRGRIRLPPLEPHARLALGALLGHPPRAQLDLGALERALVELGVGDDLVAALGSLGFAPASEAAERRAARAERHAALAAAREAAGSWADEWATDWIDEAIRSGLLRDLDAAAATSTVGTIRRVLDHLAANGDRSVSRPISRTDLAANVVGSSHALDTGTALEALVGRALAHLTDAGPDDDPWALAGVHTDQVSGAALTWALPVVGRDGLAPIVAAAAEAQVPIHLTRLALIAHPVAVAPGATVLVAENPRVVEAAAQRRAALPVITTNGNPSAAVRLLLDQLLASDAQLRYHGDFDAPGVAICARMHQLGLTPWRMNAADYRRAVANAHADGVDLLEERRGIPPTPWDPALRDAMRELGRIVHEERLLDELLTAAPPEQHR